MAAGADATQLGLMLQNLLEERFLMRAHMEARDQPVYALVSIDAIAGRARDSNAQPSTVLPSWRHG
jgi:uncharacterized protein (TIGR03435 family)